jgi:hypothetical protein
MLHTVYTYMTFITPEPFEIFNLYAVFTSIANMKTFMVNTTTCYYTIIMGVRPIINISIIVMFTSTTTAKSNSLASPINYIK